MSDRDKMITPMSKMVQIMSVTWRAMVEDMEALASGVAIGYRDMFRKNILVVGPPAIGKSQGSEAASKLVKYVVEALGIDNTGIRFIDCFPALGEAQDYGGFPNPAYKKLTQAQRDEFKKWLSNVDDEDDRALMEMIPTAVMYEMLNCIMPTVFNFDELDKANPDVKNAIAQLVHGRTFNGIRLSPYAIFMATANGLEHNCGGSPFPEHLKSRFAVYHVEVERDGWIAWAIANKIHWFVIAFVQRFPHYIYNWQPERDIRQACTPRTLHFVSDSIKKGLLVQDIGKPSQHFTPFAENMASAEIGDDAGHDLLNLIEYYKEMPDPDTIKSNPKEAPIPTGENEMSIKWVMLGSLVEHTDAYCIDAMAEYVQRLGDDFAECYKTAISQRKPECCQTQAYVELSAKYSVV
jgi:hypothetical protein